MIDGDLKNGLTIFDLAEHEPDTDLQAVLIALRHGNIDDAFRQVELIIRQDPKRARAYYYRAHIYIAKNQVRRAVTDCNFALKYNPNFADVYVIRGMLWLISKRHQMALNDFETALGLNPSVPAPYLGRGMALYQKGIYEQRIHSYMGVVDRRYGVAEFQEAMANFAHVIEMNLENKPQQVATAHWGLAFVYLALRQFDQAILYANVTIAMMPNKDNLFRERGWMYAQAGLYDQAIADLETAVQLNPQSRLNQLYYRRVKNQRRK